MTASDPPPEDGAPVGARVAPLVAGSPDAPLGADLGRPPRGPGAARGALAALAATALGVGAGQLAALAVAPAAAPVAAVAGQVVRLAPPRLVELATVGAGVGSRYSVLTGVIVVLALVVAGLGACSARSEHPGTWGLAVLGLIATVAAGAASGAGQFDVLPGITALGVAVPIFRRLHRLASRIPQLSGRGRLPDGRPSLTRRRFLRASAGAGAGGIVLGSVAALTAPLLPSARVGPARAALTARLSRLRAEGRIAAAAALPGGAAFPGGSAFVTPVADFYRIDTALRVPAVDPASWSLRIHGMVGRELTLTLEDLLRRPLVERWVTMACVSNEVGGDLVSTTRFTGVELAPLLAEAAPDPAADQVLSTSVDGWTAGSPTSLLRDPARGALLAVGMDGAALPPEHGFPVRIVVPGLYGYVSATKWVTEMELTTFAERADYWRVRGWAPPGPMETASRIDAPSSFSTVPAGPVTVTGAAWAVPRGISRVEVSADGVRWTDAVLAPVPAAGETWRMWRAELDLPAGNYTLRARATDRDGVIQTDERRSALPGAATGLPTRTVTVG